MKNIKETREAWLEKAATVLDHELLTPSGIRLPAKLHVSVGFPAGGRRGKGTHRIGECWQPEASADQHTEIFIHPELGEAERVMDVLLHELIHASGIWDHKAGFKAAATKVGLTGKMTATMASDTLAVRIKDMLRELPPYPHAALSPGEGKTTAPKKQGTRMLALTCPGCGYKVRTSAKWIEVGVPQCPCGLDLEPEGI
jgi:hypothetical protein